MSVHISSNFFGLLFYYYLFVASIRRTEGGREGGRSVRSIATPKKDSDGGSGTFKSFVDDKLVKSSLEPAEEKMKWNTGAGLKQSDDDLDDIDRYRRLLFKHFPPYIMISHL